MTPTISTRIPDDLKSDLDEFDDNLSDIVRDALEREVRARRRQQLLDAADDAADAFGDTPSTEEIVTAVRETREEN